MSGDYFIYHPSAVLAILRVSLLIKNTTSITISTLINQSLENMDTPIATGIGINMLKRTVNAPSRTPRPAGVKKAKYPAANEIAYMPHRTGI